MNLQPINPPLRDGQSVQCCKCRKMSHNILADMDGEPFLAFYCAECLKTLNRIPNCPYCNGERELSGTPGIYSCFFCGRDAR